MKLHALLLCCIAAAAHCSPMHAMDLESALAKCERNRSISPGPENNAEHLREKVEQLRAEAARAQHKVAIQDTLIAQIEKNRNLTQKLVARAQKEQNSMRTGIAKLGAMGAQLQKLNGIIAELTQQGANNPSAENVERLRKTQAERDGLARQAQQEASWLQIADETIRDIQSRIERLQKKMDSLMESLKINQ